MSVQKENESWEAIRRRVLDRDGHACRFCDMTEEEHQEEHDQGLHAHHVLPRDAGGDDHPDNLVTVCTACHRTIESVHADAVKHHTEEGITSDEVDNFYDGFLSVSKGGFEKINEYLKQHPSLERSHGIYHSEHSMNLSDAAGYSFGSPYRDEFKINSEYDLVYLIGYSLAVEDVACALDGARADGVEEVI